ncbi:MAG: hypothetical protein ACYDH5_11500 [Acidimicrobiales bacterium]
MSMVLVVTRSPGAGLLARAVPDDEAPGGLVVVEAPGAAPRWAPHAAAPRETMTSSPAIAAERPLPGHLPAGMPIGRREPVGRPEPGRAVGAGVVGAGVVGAGVVMTSSGS